MTAISLRLDDDLLESLDSEAEQTGVSRSEYIRATLEARHETDVLHEHIEDLQAEIDELETERDRLQRQLTATNQRVEEHQELVEYVEEERSLSKRRAHAGVLTRAKWWLTGMPEDGDEE